jgi:hypothetical protein
MGAIIMNNAFLVRLSMSVWNARKMDKGATRAAQARAHAGDKAGVKVYKSVIAADALDAIQRIANAARAEHRQRTVPWSYEGPGAITAEGYPAYKAVMATFEREFNKAVAKFFSVYAEERDNARKYLGDLFDANDYPDSANLGEKFAFTIACEPMPQAHDFRVQGLPKEVVDDIKLEIAERNADAIDNANVTAWQRIIEKVEKLKMALQNYKPAKDGKPAEGKFHDTLVDNIKELAGLIPSINIANDPDLTRMQQKLNSLTAYTAQDLRDDEKLRADISKQANLILSQIDAMARAA